MDNILHGLLLLLVLVSGLSVIGLCAMASDALKRNELRRRHGV